MPWGRRARQLIQKTFAVDQCLIDVAARVCGIWDLRHYQVNYLCFNAYRDLMLGQPVYEPGHVCATRLRAAM